MEPAIHIANERITAPREVGSRKRIDVSIVIPISERHDDLRELYFQYGRELSITGRTHEFIFVLDGPDHDALETLKALKQEHPENVSVIALNRWFGEATALSVGFDKARGEVILTLPSYFQVEPHEVHRMFKKLAEDDQDLVVAWRHPRIDSRFNRAQSWVFHWLVRLLTGARYRDVSCGLRVMRRNVAEEIHLYGDLHRFFPVSAYQRGFHVSEIPVQQSPQDARLRVYRPGVYLRRLLDILTFFFLFKFTKKPLRFFGLIGSGIFGAGTIITVYIGAERLFGTAPAARPLLILGVLLMVFGIQLFSTGLLGEIIIFTHARDVKEYHVEEIVG